jgi:L-iditol 2-dehydrogenase
MRRCVEKSGSNLSGCVLCKDVKIYLSLYLVARCPVSLYGYPYIFPRNVAILPKLNLKPVIGAVYPIDEVVEAFEASKKGVHPKILIKCS